ncbi:MAG: PAS domain S-box protein [Gemmatimonadota bacterium]
MNSRFLGVAVLLGILAWMLDAAVGAFIFREGAFWALAVFSVPPDALVFRIIVLALFLGFGLFVSDSLFRRESRDWEAAHRAFRASEEWFRGLAELLPEPVFEADLTFRLTYANRRAFEMFGYSQEDFEAGLYGFDMLIPEDRDRAEASLRDRLEGDDPGAVEYTAVRKDGSTLPILFHAALFRIEGRPVGVRGIVIDITERKGAEEALRESEARFRSVIQQLNDATYILFNDRLDLVNPRFCEITGVSPEEAAGEEFQFWDLVAPESIPVIRKRQEKRERGEEVPGIYEFEIKHRDGRCVQVEASVTEIDYRGGKAVLGLLRDVTEQKSLKEQLLLAQKLESIGRLSGGVAHDLNNLLTPIIGYGDLLLGELSLDDERRESIKEILQAAFRARDLVRQLLAFSRRQTLEFSAIDLNGMVREFQNLLRRTIREDIEIRFIPTPTEPNIRGDRGQLEQVIMNLAVNARDAMPEGGILTIETSEVELDGEYARAHSGVISGHYAMLSFSDDGVGMDAETREKVFEPFFTTKERGKGTGLGLATVYGIVKQHGGNIWAYSEPGVGSTFKCYFPLADMPSVEQVALRNTITDLSGTETIMIVEDEATVRDLAVRVLNSHGYSVLEAEEGEACLVFLGDYDGPLDMLLTDVVMPGMNGRELHGEVRRLFPQAKVLYMSGYTEDIVTHRGVLDEGIPFIQKPFSVQDLATKVRAVLEED